MSTDMYDDSAKGGYSYAEKLKAVADGLMDPKEIGMASAEDAQIKLVPDANKKPVFGTTLMFRAGCVPIELRLHWAEQEFKKNRTIVSADATGFDKEAFLAVEKDKYPIQGDLICGQANAKFGQTFSDPVIGLAQMLRIAADKLEAYYLDATKTENSNENQDTAVQDQQPQ